MKLVIDIPEEVYKCVMDGTYCGMLYEELKNGVPVETRGDCISRQAAIDINRSHHGQMPNHINFQMFKEIEALPSVEPERKPGRWIENDTIRQCNMCRALYPKGQRCGAYHYCPNCGAKMEG